MIGGVQIFSFILNLGTRRKWLISLKFWPPYLGKKAPGTHWKGKRVDSRDDLDILEIRQFLLMPGRVPSIVQPVGYHYTKYTMPAFPFHKNTAEITQNV